ncbi:amino acid permease [Furfurilactobacillus entadae]|uniref:amino acid permease n=1 Tax=Furfurilactobacillus entadae TaxID=2922307 RepID=UPI0035E73BAE
MKSQPTLSAFGFFTLTAAMLMSADEYPAFAQSGLLATFFLVAAGLLWFLPVALVAAQMATVPGWHDGGVYTWVKGGLGQRAGFIAIFFQWLQITVNFITMIYFVIGVLAYAVGIPSLNTNPWLKFALFIFIYWVMTAGQLRGINGTDRIVKWTFMLGIVLPAFILLGLGIAYLLQGHPLQFTTSISSNVTTLSHSVSLTTIVPYILAFTGIEASASYIMDLKRPARNYPLIMLVLVVFAIVLDSFGGLSVAAVVPARELSLNQGVIQAIAKMINIITSQPLSLVVKGLGLLMAVGMLGEISSWIVGPVKSLLVTAEDNILSPWFSTVNKDQVPVRLVILQGALVTLIGLVLTVGFGGNNAAFSMAMSLTVMLYLVMYILMFTAFLRLSLKRQFTTATFKVPGGFGSELVIGGLGLISSLLVFGSTFLPTSSTTITKPVYAAMMGGFFLIVLAATLFIYSRRQTGHVTRSWHVRHLRHDEVPKFTQIQGRGEHTIEPNEPKQ